MASKIHVKVVLDLFVVADSHANVAQRLSESAFIVDPDNNALDEVIDVQDITVEKVEVTDSR